MKFYGPQTWKIKSKLISSYTYMAYHTKQGSRVTEVIDYIHTSKEDLLCCLLHNRVRVIHTDHLHARDATNARAALPLKLDALAVSTWCYWSEDSGVNDHKLKCDHQKMAVVATAATD